MNSEMHEKMESDVNNKILNADNAILKVLRLQNGLDIVGPCFFFEDQDFMVIAQPMIIHYSRDIEKETTSIHLFPWLPLEIAGENVVEIKLNQIVTSFITTDDFMEEYFEFVGKIEKYMNEEISKIKNDDLNYQGTKH